MNIFSKSKRTDCGEDSATTNLTTGKRNGSASFYVTACKFDRSFEHCSPKLVEVTEGHFDYVFEYGNEISRDIVECRGLGEFQYLLENIDDRTRLHPGIPVPPELIEAYRTSYDTEDSPDEISSHLLGPVSDSMFNLPCHPALICFEVQCYEQSPEDAWEKLCRVDPSLSSVGYLQTSYVWQHMGNDKAEIRYQFYCVAKDGLDLPRYATAFLVKSYAVQPFQLKYISEDLVYFDHWVNSGSLSAECSIYGQDYLALFGPTSTSMKSGLLLDTRVLNDPTESECLHLDKVIDDAFSRWKLDSDIDGKNSRA